MPLSVEARSSLHSQQAVLVSALVSQGELPAGFDKKRLHAAAASLARKRAWAVARTWPGLTQGLGPRFGELFAAYAEDMPLPSQGGPLADGRAFARWLKVGGELPEAGFLQSLAVDLRYARKSDGLVIRKWPTCKTAWLPLSRRLVMAARLPWLGERWLSIRLSSQLDRP